MFLFLSWWTDLWINIWVTNMGYRWILNIASQLVHLSCKQRCLLGWYSFYSLYTTICRGFITVDVVLIPIKPRWPQVALAGGALAKGGGGICVPGIGWNICMVWTMVFTIKFAGSSRYSLNETNALKCEWSEPGRTRSCQRGCKESQRRGRASRRYLPKRYPLVNVYILPWKITMLLMGKSTITMAIFHSKMLVHQRVNQISLEFVGRTPALGIPEAASYWGGWQGVSFWVR